MPRELENSNQTIDTILRYYSAVGLLRVSPASEAGYLARRLALGAVVLRGWRAMHARRIASNQNTTLNCHNT
jgi:hypothetical protein